MSENLESENKKVLIPIDSRHIRDLKIQISFLKHEKERLKAKLDTNLAKLKELKTLPYLVARVLEIIEISPEEMGAVDEDDDIVSKNPRKYVVIEMRRIGRFFLPKPGLVDVEKLKPNDLVAVHPDKSLIMEILPPHHDIRVGAMDLVERPTAEYTDVGGLDQQMQELTEAVVLPLTHPEKFKNLGIQAPKGVLMYGPTGTGKTMLARVCAARTKSTFMRLTATQLMDIYRGEGAIMIRDAFRLAKEKAPTILFIDEIDSVCGIRSETSRDSEREAHRTMLELLNQLDGFSSNDGVKVVAATNRVDILDPALLRSGRLDRKVEFPLPDETTRAKIIQIHSRKMHLSDEVDFEELARCTDDFNGAQCRAVCIEAGMIAVRRGGIKITHEDMIEAVSEVQAKKKIKFNYYA